MSEQSMGMMNITGPVVSGLVERTNDQPLQLRVNQRIVAEILKVAGDQVTMVVQGMRVVGKLASGEQAGLLSDRKMAQFIVRGMVDGQIQLAIAKPETQAAAPTPSGQQWLILARNLLQLNGLEANQENMLISQALLNRGMPVTADLVKELQTALQSLGKWGLPEAELAAAFKANALPLSPGALQLALQRLPSVADALLNLQTAIANWIRSNRGAGPEMTRLAQNAQQVLEQAMVQWDGTPSSILEKLPEAVSIWGKSLESILAQSQDGSDQIANDQASLMTLARFRSELASRGDTRLVGEIDRFLDAARQVQFLNTARPNDLTNPPWLTLNLPLAAALAQQPGTHPEMVPAHLRVAYQPNNAEQTIDPLNTRLVLSVDLEGGDFLQVDLSMVGRRVGAWMTVSNSPLQSLVEEEMPSFKEGLEKLGYNLEFARCEVGSNSGQTAQPAVLESKKVDIEV